MTPEQLLERLESAERVATGPPAEVGSRVWAAIEGRLANGPAAPELDQEPLFDQPLEGAAEAATSVGGSSSVVLKIVGVLGIVGVVGGGLALLDNRDREPEPEPLAAAIEPSVPAEPEAVEPEPALPEPEVVEPEPALPEPSEPEESQLPEPSKPANKKLEPKGPAKTLADEVALMQAISTALKQGDSRKVLKLVAEHERDFGKGQFLEERRAAKARALCQAGKLSAGKKEAASFASRWPSSIHLTSVKQDCGLE